MIVTAKTFRQKGLGLHRYESIYFLSLFYSRRLSSAGLMNPYPARVTF